MPLRDWLQRYSAVLYVLLVTLGAVFLLRAVAGSLSALTAPVTIDITALSIAIVLVCAGFLAHLSAWFLVLRFAGKEIDFLSTASTYCLYQVTTYIPGTLWQFIGIAERGEQLGIGRKDSSATILLQQVVGVLASLLFATYYLFTQVEVLSSYRYLLLILIVAGFISIHPSIFQYPINHVLRLLKQEPLSLNLQYRQMMVLLGVSLASWLLMGAGFAFLVRGATVHTLSILDATGVYAAAWAVGFLVIIVPGGIGVRESVLVFLLTPITGVSTAALLSVAARLWSALPELVFTALFGVYERARRT